MESNAGGKTVAERVVEIEELPVSVEKLTVTVLLTTPKLVGVNKIPTEQFPVIEVVQVPPVPGKLPP